VEHSSHRYRVQRLVEAISRRCAGGPPWQAGRASSPHTHSVANGVEGGAPGEVVPVCCSRRTRAWRTPL